MSFKQWQAVITLLSEVPVILWLWTRSSSDPVETVAEAATRLLWAMGVLIGFNIVVSIAVVIAISIAQGKEFKDERADERDRGVNARSGRNAHFVLSVSGLGILIGLASGVDPITAAYLLFAALMLSAAADSVSKLVYYRVG